MIGLYITDDLYYQVLGRTC